MDLVFSGIRCPPLGGSGEGGVWAEKSRGEEKWCLLFFGEHLTCSGRYVVIRRLIIAFGIRPDIQQGTARLRETAFPPPETDRSLREDQ